MHLVPVPGGPRLYLVQSEGGWCTLGSLEFAEPPGRASLNILITHRLVLIVSGSAPSGNRRERMFTSIKGRGLRHEAFTRRCSDLSETVSYCRGLERQGAAGEDS